MATPEPRSAPPADAPPQAYDLKVRYACGVGPLNAAWRLTAHGVVRWCDAYLVKAETRWRPDGPPEPLPGREGRLPAEPDARPAALEAVFDWLEQTRGGPDPRVLLSRAGAPVLTDYGRSHFALWLTRAQFAALQDWWARVGLPRDLCYPPTDDPEADDPLFRPEEVTAAELAARKQRLVADCGRLLRALSVRELQLGHEAFELPDDLLHAPALATHAAEYRVVQGLSTTVGRAMLALARLAHGWGPPPPEPEAEPRPA